MKQRQYQCLWCMGSGLLYLIIILNQYSTAVETPTDAAPLQTFSRGGKVNKTILEATHIDKEYHLYSAFHLLGVRCLLQKPREGYCEAEKNKPSKAVSNSTCDDLCHNNHIKASPRHHPSCDRSDTGR